MRSARSMTKRVTSGGDATPPPGRTAGLAHRTLQSPLGALLLAVSVRGIVRLVLPGEARSQVLARLPEREPQTALGLPAGADQGRRDPQAILGLSTTADQATREIDEYFHGSRRVFTLDVDWSLTSGFPRQVLEAATRIPYGKIATYGQLAAAAGSPRAARATGRVLASNPVPILVPCHRVVPAAGGIGGYAGGPDMKIRLLQLEGAM